MQKNFMSLFLKKMFWVWSVKHVKARLKILRQNLDIILLWEMFFIKGVTKQNLIT